MINVYILLLRDKHIHLKWIPKLFLAWLSLVAHERLILYERCVIIYLYDSRDSNEYMKFSEEFIFMR